MMKLTETGFDGLVIIEPQVFKDDRGYFMESYNLENFQSLGIQNSWVQDNQSRSVKGVIRGLHYQLNPFAQSKLIRVIEGEIYDVALDIRQGSKTFGKWYGIYLSDENKKQFLVPAGFAHGLSVVSETATVLYKSDSFYKPESERGIDPMDPKLAIDWRIEKSAIILSDKDRNSPPLKTAEYNFNV